MEATGAKGGVVVTVRTQTDLWQVVAVMEVMVDRAVMGVMGVMVDVEVILEKLAIKACYIINQIQ